jgi:SAM-dependent methyltransferase
MDEIAKYNIERWEALVQANALFTRPRLDLNADSARELIDREGRLGDVAGKDVLCLAGGGGKQSEAFALLGANVTVFDLSEAQLQRNLEAAEHYGLTIKTVHGDMRDLSAFEDNSFDIVTNPYSLNFVPDVRLVFAGAARVLRPEGTYYFNCANPFYFGLTEQDWNGEGYTLKRPYVQGAKTQNEDNPWVYDRDQNAPVPPPIEFHHTLSALTSGLTGNGFVIDHIDDHFDPDPEAEPGSWDHFLSIAPPWLTFWTTFRP